MAPHIRQLPLRVGLLGKGIQRSRTPAMHEAEAARQGLPYRYDLIDTAGADPEPDIETLLCQVESEGFAGLNVTFPYKRAVIPFLDHVSRTVQRVGACNTLVLREGRRVGHNTDMWGFGQSLARGLSGAPRERVLLLGAGGGGGAVAHALLGWGAGTLIVADRDKRAAQDLVSTLRQAGGQARVAGPLTREAAQASGIVNATPMGMAAYPGTAIDPNLLRPAHWVADIVYFPRETELLAAARAIGCQTLDGSGMAVFQAVRAFELFSGKAADPDVMRATFARFDR